MIPHGSYKIEVRNQIIIVRFYDDWNRETSELMCQEFIKIAQKISDKPWACIVDLQEWGLGEPSIMEPIIKTNQWCAQNNQKLEAVVCSQQIQEYLLRELHKALPGVESDFFATESSAIAWLDDKGFKLY